MKKDVLNNMTIQLYFKIMNNPIFIISQDHLKKKVFDNL